MKLRVIETFSGIGAQAKAFERIKKNNPSFDYEIVATVEWEIGAMYAYDIIHKGKQDLSKYDRLTKGDLIDILNDFNLSSDGKQTLSSDALLRMPEIQMKAILHAIENNNNKVDISTVHAEDLPEADLLTYSFPCQDLSISSFWHQNFTGIDRDAKNRSSLLWEIERILKEYHIQGLKKPKYLLMENVTAIKSPRHLDNFKMWISELENLGYKSFDLDLNAKDFGIPQNRIRTYMLSVLTDDNHTWSMIENHLQQINLFVAKEEPLIDPFLRLNYFENEVYLREALESIPNFTPSRQQICEDSSKLAIGQETKGLISKTITTKQDRNPNAGIILHGLSLGDDKAPYRNLTPRETFLLMGFDESDFDTLMLHNINISKSRTILSHSKLLKLAGNSIVVNVLEMIFKEIITIDYNYFQNVVPLERHSKKIG